MEYLGVVRQTKDMPPGHERYAADLSDRARDDAELVVDATTAGNLSRFLNFSHNPNTIFSHVRRAIYAYYWLWKVIVSNSRDMSMADCELLSRQRMISKLVTMSQLIMAASILLLWRIVFVLVITAKVIFCLPRGSTATYRRNKKQHLNCGKNGVRNS